MKEKIIVLRIEPMQHPKIYYIEPSMQAFKKAVDADGEHGKVEAKQIGKHVFAVFHHDRFLTDLPPNRRIGDDIIAGTMYIVAVDEHSHPVSMTDEQIDKYALHFWSIETFDDIDVAEANINTLFSRLWKDEE